MVLLNLYRGVTGLAAPIVRWQLDRRVARGKEDPARLGERLGTASLPRPDGPLVWLHAASVGESVSLLPLIDSLREARPDLTLLLTSGTVTSAKLMAVRLPPGVLHQYAPVDLPAAVRRFLDHWRPSLALRAESELWPNVILAMRRRGIPMALVNGRMSPRSFSGWRRWPRSARRLLGSFDMLLAQSPVDAERLAELVGHEVAMPGNLKYAAAPLPVDDAALTVLRKEVGDRPVWLAASTHDPEEQAVARVHVGLAERLHGLLTIIVPRHPERGLTIAEDLRDQDLAVAQRSQDEKLRSTTQIYLADTLGELGLFYRLAPTALIGGSLIPHGGQNPLEAARLGCVPLFGPHTDNFADITQKLEDDRAALRVADEDSLVVALLGLLQDPAARGRIADAAMAAARQEADVVTRTMAALAPLLDRIARAPA